MPVWSVVMFDC